MSYVIHNFSSHYHTLRMNWKVRSLQLVRNYVTLYTMFSSNPLFTICSTSTWIFPILLFRTNYIYFTRLYDVLFPDVYEIKHSPIGVNFARSAQFTTLRNLDILFSWQMLPNPPLRPFQSLRTYSYPFGTALAITPIAKSFYANLLYRFFRMSLSVWFYMSSTYKLWVHYTLITPHFRCIPFLNKYYFKIYHV